MLAPLAPANVTPVGKYCSYLFSIMSFFTLNRPQGGGYTEKKYRLQVCEAFPFLWMSFHLSLPLPIPLSPFPSLPHSLTPISLSLTFSISLSLISLPLLLSSSLSHYLSPSLPLFLFTKLDFNILDKNDHQWIPISSTTSFFCQTENAFSPTPLCFMNKQNSIWNSVFFSR